MKIKKEKIMYDDRIFNIDGEVTASYDPPTTTTTTTTTTTRIKYTKVQLVQKINEVEKENQQLHKYIEELLATNRESTAANRDLAAAVNNLIRE